MNAKGTSLRYEDDLGSAVEVQAVGGCVEVSGRATFSPTQARAFSTGLAHAIGEARVQWVSLPAETRCPNLWCRDVIFGTNGDIDSGLRHHMDYCEESLEYADDTNGCDLPEADDRGAAYFDIFSPSRERLYTL